MIYGNRRFGVRELLAGMFVLILMLFAFSLIEGQDVEPQVETESTWIMQTRLYPSTRGGTWDAYILNTHTGELFFVNQSTKTPVREGRARGASGD